MGVKYASRVWSVFKSLDKIGLRGVDILKAPVRVIRCKAGGGGGVGPSIKTLSLKNSQKIIGKLYIVLKQ